MWIRFMNPNYLKQLFRAATYDLHNIQEESGPFFIPKLSYSQGVMMWGYYTGHCPAAT